MEGTREWALALWGSRTMNRSPSRRPGEVLSHLNLGVCKHPGRRSTHRRIGGRTEDYARTAARIGHAELGGDPRAVALSDEPCMSLSELVRQSSSSSPGRLSWIASSSVTSCTRRSSHITPVVRKCADAMLFVSHVGCEEGERRVVGEKLKYSVYTSNSHVSELSHCTRVPPCNNNQ